jgi:hypothetical protein
MKILRYIGLCFLLHGVLTASAQSDAISGETIHLRYELLLKRCKAEDCSTVSVAKNDIQVVLTPKDGNTLAGAQAVDLQADGLNFHATLMATSHPQAGSRALDVKLQVNQQTVNAQASGYAHKAAQCIAWSSLPVLDVTGSPYTVGDAQVTPTLEVKIAP